MIHPTSVITCPHQTPLHAFGRCRCGLTIWMTIHLALLPVRELSQAKTSIAISCRAYPPIGMALISETVNRRDPSGFLTSFCGSVSLHPP